MRIETVRAFIAVELTDEIRTSIDSVIRRLNDQAGLPVRWVSVPNIHLTIKFLGEVATSKIEKIILTVSEVTKHVEPFTIQVGGLGVFPGIRRPRVIWIGVTAPKELSQLANEIEKSCTQLGFPTEGRSFSPHLTIGRVQQSAPEEGIRAISQSVSKASVGYLGNENVNGIFLFRSVLKPEGAVYSMLHEFPLLK